VSDRGYNIEPFTGGPTVMFADGTVSEPVTEVVNMNNWLKGYVVEGLDKSLVMLVVARHGEAGKGSSVHFRRWCDQGQQWSSGGEDTSS